jgi:hypothetical protein
MFYIPTLKKNVNIFEVFLNFVRFSYVKPHRSAGISSSAGTKSRRCGELCVHPSIRPSTKWRSGEVEKRKSGEVEKRRSGEAE